MAQASRSRSRLPQRHHLNRCVTNFLEEPVQGRTLHQDFPSAACALTKNDVCDPFTLRERDESVRRTTRANADHGGAELLSQRDIPLERISIRGLDVSR